MSRSESPVPRILLVYPHFARNNLINFEHLVSFYPGRRAVMPPLGLLTFGGRIPPEWKMRLVDENVRPLAEQDLRWADVVAVSGMHPQRDRIREILDWANRLGKLTILGGPSVSIAPEYYPQADVIHVGEMGDATDALMAFLETRPAKPGQQLVFRTEQKAPLDEHPMPALGLIDVHKYTVLPLQYSVGCPYRCEFCDIPVIYGMHPRNKSGPRVAREMQAIYDTGFLGQISFVDDNLIANRQALRNMLPDLIRWQREHRYPYPLHAEVSVDLASEPEILELLREARFTYMFLGVESLDSTALNSVSKRHNTRRPAMETVRTLQSYGIEIVLGLILGFDSDSQDTGRAYAQFVEEAAIPIVYLNLLCALPKTPLWYRMEAEGRLIPDQVGDRQRSNELLCCLSTNLRYKLPNATVQQMLFDTIRTIYAPANVYQRLRWNADNVYGRQLSGIPPIRSAKEVVRVLSSTLQSVVRVLWGIGVRSRERRHFWPFLAQLIRLRLQGRIKSVLEVLLRATPTAHHLVVWRDKLLAEVQNHPLQTRSPEETKELLARSAHGQ